MRDFDLTCEVIIDFEDHIGEFNWIVFVEVRSKRDAVRRAQTEVFELDFVVIGVIAQGYNGFEYDFENDRMFRGFERSFERECVQFL